MSALVAIDGLRVAYGSGASAFEALKGVTMEIGAGERVAVIGESGSGKSTLALALAGLLPATATQSGGIGWPRLDHQPRNGADIGFVFQDPAGSLDPVMTVGRQVAEVITAHRDVGRSRALEMAAALFERVRLPDPASFLHAYPHQLSGGQKQRVGIAAAIAAGPRLLIADEPTSALDTIVQAEIMALIGSLVVETGMTLLLITHDITLASTVAEQIAVLKDGVIVESGTAGRIVTQPAEAYTKALLAATLTLEGIGAGPRWVR